MCAQVSTQGRSRDVAPTNTQLPLLVLPWKGDMLKMGWGCRMQMVGGGGRGDSASPSCTKSPNSGAGEDSDDELFLEAEGKERAESPRATMVLPPSSASASSATLTSPGPSSPPATLPAANRAGPGAALHSTIAGLKHKAEELAQAEARFALNARVAADLAKQMTSPFSFFSQAALFAQAQQMAAMAASSANAPLLQVPHQLPSFTSTQL